jgi:hypothetical protein
MIEESKRIEYWNYLTTEKNQPRPKGITVQRLAVIKLELIRRAEVWRRIIESHGALERRAADFYESSDPSSVRSRTDFWEAVRSIIVRDESRKNRLPESPMSHRRSISVNSRKNPAGKNRRSRSKR